MDKPGENDTTFENNGYNLIISNDLLTQVRSVTIEFSPLGFSLVPEVPLSGGGGGCSSCGGSCATGT